MAPSAERMAGAGRWLSDAVPGFLLLCMGLGAVMATVAAAIRFAERLADMGGWVVAGIALWLVAAAVAIAGMRLLARHFTGWHYAATVIGAYAVVLLGLVFDLGNRMQWRGDSMLLWKHVGTFAENGYTPETLSAMSDSYDYQVWTRRTVPWYALVRRICGAEGSIRGVQLFHTAVMVLAACLTWRLGRVLFGGRVAAIALAFHVLMPWRLFTHLDLAHHIVGSFYYTLGVWILVEWHRPGRGRAAKALLCIPAALLLPLMRLEGGIDFVFLGGVAATVFLMVLAGRIRLRNAAVDAVALLLVPLLASSLLVGPFDKRVDEADLHHYDSGIPAWTLRGWCLETGGQYYSDYEQVDCLTPRELKAPMLGRILAGQAFYNTSAVAFRHIPLKMAKYFMAGYASSFEELLLAPERRPARGIYMGARNAFLFCLLPCAAAGMFWMLPVGRRKNLLPFIVPFATLVGAYVVFGESDARYSSYIHSFLFLSAAAFLARRRRTPEAAATVGTEGGNEVLRGSIAPAGIAFAVCTVWICSLYAFRPLLAKQAVWDMRKATILEGKTVQRSSTLAPFAIEFAATTQEPVWGRIALPVPLGNSARFTFYLLPHDIGLSASRNTPMVLRRNTPSGSAETPILLPARVEVDFAPGDEKAFELAASGAVAPFALRIGYATLDVTAGADGLPSTGTAGESSSAE